MIVAVTGRRDLEGKDDWVRSEMDRIVTKTTPTAMISGMAQGADMLWAQSAEANSVPLIAHCPFPQQARSWVQQDQDERERLLKYAQDVSFAGEFFDKKFYFVRNTTMMEAADTVVAVWGKDEKGGTWDAVKKARKLKKTIIHVDFKCQRTTIERPAEVTVDPTLFDISG